MSSTIFKAVLGGAVFYIILMVLEAALHPQVWPGAIIGGIILAVLASIFAAKSEHAVHTGEVVLLWAMILLFTAYGLSAFFGGFTWS